MKQFLLCAGLIFLSSAPGFAQASLPATFPIATQEEFNTYRTVDANADGKTWKYETRAACYEGIGTSFADDWLILGPIDLSDPANSFTLTLEAWKTYMAESYEVCISPTGETADAITIFSTSDIPNSAAPVSADFSVPSPGAYHLMIHANSPSNGISLYIRNVQVQANEAEGFSVPFEMTPAADEARFFTALNSNEDSKTWGYDLSNQGFAIECTATSASDDWLLFPEVTFPEAGRYMFQWDARSWGDPQMMDVLIGQGDDPSAYQILFKDKEIGGTLYTREVVFEISDPGAYRMAFHTYTPANRYKLLTKNYRITETDKPLPLLFLLKKQALFPSGLTGSSLRHLLSMKVPG